jgi:hypothetical protein
MADKMRSYLGAPSLGISNSLAPPAEPRALRELQSEWRRVVEVAAAFGLPLPTLGAVTVAALAGPLEGRA